jgi:YD repeat-containing protein
MNTLRALLPLALLLSLAACPPVEPTSVQGDLSDRQNDPRADLPGLGGPDPGAGLPDLYAESCRVLESRVLGRDALETLELTDDTEGRPRRETRAFNGDETGRSTYVYDAQGRWTQVDATSNGLRTTTRLTWDNGGRLTGATVTEPFGDVTTFVYTWAGDRLVSMAAEARYGDVSAVSRWGARYAYASDGRLVKKSILSYDDVALTVGYDYDKNGHLVVKRFKEPARTALPVEDAYT